MAGPWFRVGDRHYNLGQAVSAEELPGGGLRVRFAAPAYELVSLAGARPVDTVELRGDEAGEVRALLAGGEPG